MRRANDRAARWAVAAGLVGTLIWITQPAVAADHQAPASPHPASVRVQAADWRPHESVLLCGWMWRPTARLPDTSTV